MVKTTSSIWLAALLAWPLISQAAPYIGIIFFLLAGVLIVFVINSFGIDSLQNFWITSLGKLLFLINLTFFYGMCLAVHAVSFSIVKDAVRGIVYMCAWLAIVQVNSNNRNKYFKKVTRYFSEIVLLSSIGLAALGLIKYGVGLDGVYWRFLEADPALYPWGASLVGDYNFYSLTLFIGGFIILKYWSQSVTLWNAYVYGAIFALVYSAAWLAGSRRFWILSIILFPMYLMWINNHARKFNIKLRWRELIIGVLLVFSLIYIVKFLWAPACDNAESKSECVVYESRIEQRVEKSVGIGRLEAVMSRVDRWIYAIESGSAREKLLGNGFVYRKDFGCRFEQCNSDDFPHAPILSGLLYGGVIAAILTAALMIYALIVAYAIIKSELEFTDFAFGLIAVVAYVAISGDTLFSTPVFLSMLLISKAAFAIDRN